MKTIWLIVILWHDGFPGFAGPPFNSLKDCRIAAEKIVQNKDENAVCVKGFKP